MEQNTNTAKEITFGDLCRLFAGKWVLFLVLALVFGFVGGAFGVVSAIDNRTYGATLTFNISDSQNSDDLLYLLRSESFAEKLLLEENGLPKKEDCDAADYAAAEAALKKVADLRAERQTIVEQLDRRTVEFRLISLTYSQLETDYNEISLVLESLRPQTDAVVDTATKLLIAEYNLKLTASKNEMDTFLNETYRPKNQEIKQLENKLALLELDLRDAKEDADEAAEKVLAPWRARADVRGQIQAIIDGVTYTYESPLDSKASTSTTNAAHKGYIVVRLSVGKNEALAAHLVDRFKTQLPAFVEAYIEDTSEEAVKADCKLVSTFADVETPSISYYVTEGVKFAAIGAIGAVALVYIILVLRLLVRTESAAKKSKEE